MTSSFCPLLLTHDIAVAVWELLGERLEDLTKVNVVNRPDWTYFLAWVFFY